MDAYELLTKDEMTILKEHYVLVKNCTTQADQKTALKDWSDAQRRLVVKLQEKLRSHNLLIIGRYPSGSLRFGMIVKSATVQIMELSDDDFMAYKKGLLKFVGGRLQRVNAECQ
ncbi:MAG: hypothetical protein ACOYBT_10470 [Polynucleobacter sp.]